MQKACHGGANVRITVEVVGADEVVEDLVTANVGARRVAVHGHAREAVAADGVVLDDVVVGGGAGDRSGDEDARTLPEQAVVEDDVVPYHVVVHAPEGGHELVRLGVEGEVVAGQRDAAVIGVVGHDVARR